MQVDISSLSVVVNSQIVINYVFYVCLLLYCSAKNLFF